MRKQSGSFKRLIRKYEFLLEDWKDVEDIASGAMSDFIADVGKNLPPEIQQSDYLVDASENEKEHTEETESDKVLKKLFRKIVLQCHPDRLIGDFSELERIRRISLYERAVSAHDDKNWALMVITAIKLDVELPEEAEDMIDSISEEVNKLEEKIAEKSSGHAWEYLNADKETKELLVQNFINLIIVNKSKKTENELKNAEDELKRIEKESKEPKLILGLGHPRTGTGYTAKLLQSWGLDVGHEKMGEHGTVDWSLSLNNKSIWQQVDFSEYNWKNIIYCVRDPRHSIPSIAYTENIEGSASFEMRKELLKLTGNSLTMAINSIVELDDLIMKLNPIVYRIEDQSEYLFKKLESLGVPVLYSDIAIGSIYNAREHESIEELLKNQRVMSPARRKINKYCEIHGYDPLFNY